ncbi:MAG: hypothetical protein ACYCUF_04340 [Acidimicrobiales bacterium]|jgi:hypothetical protein
MSGGWHDEGGGERCDSDGSDRSTNQRGTLAPLMRPDSPDKTIVHLAVDG